MGGRGGITEQIVNNPVVPLGDNVYETGAITVPAGGVIPAGVVLYRNSGKFVPVTDVSPITISVDVSGDLTNVSIPGTLVQVPVAVNPFDIKNPGQAPADFSIRALVSGKVRADLLTINGDPITVDEGDMLRNYGILPIRVNDISRLE
jgi:hypothetical protein